MRFQFEAEGNTNVLWGRADDGFQITATVEVPEGASEDFGYITMKKAILEEIAARELNIDATFPYDNQEQHLSMDASEGVAEIDVCD